MITRRHFLASASIPLLAPKLAFAENNFRLRAEDVSLDLLPDAKPTELWGYNGSTPGPVIRAKRGERVKIQFENALNQASAVHWHGVRIDNKMDGVPDLTQPIVEAGDEFLYDFVVPDAGTYWYHSHNRSWEQVARGLYGALIVEEDKPPQVDHDIVVIIDDWRLNADGSQAGNFENMHDQAHDGRLGNFAKAIFQGVNSPLRRGQRIRLRLINTATDRVFPLQISGIEGKVVALDGMPLRMLQPIEDINLAPAQRADILADVIGDELTIFFPTRDGLFKLGDLQVSGETDQLDTSEITSLEPNHYQAPDLNDAIELTLKMEGGAMSRRMMMGGMSSDNIWAFNDVSGMQDKPFHRFKSGQTAIINLVNETQFPHAIHLHGHHFQAVEPLGLAPMRDTILVAAGESQKIACVFDNVGKWLLHCHMLAHQATGMKTWVEVQA